MAETRSCRSKRKSSMGAGEAELASPSLRVAPVVWSKKRPRRRRFADPGRPYQNRRCAHAQVLSKRAHAKLFGTQAAPPALFLAEAVELHHLCAATSGPRGRSGVLRGCRRGQRSWLRPRISMRRPLLVHRLLCIGQEVGQRRGHMLAGEVVGSTRLAELQTELSRRIVERFDRLERH